MPELMEQMFCSQQIVVPPKFPYVLKRYCKAAIKTQPYDLLRWSYEYFKALSQHRHPPVKLRLEYPVYSTEGGLTRGCLKVLAHQLGGMTEVPIPTVKAAWGGFCLDISELNQILCLCEVYQRSETVPFFHFIAVAGGLLTKSLTHTMILLCESLTKEPDGASAAIPAKDFLTMYKYLARMDASTDTQYMNGYREGKEPVPEDKVDEEQEEEKEPQVFEDESISDDYWSDSEDLQKLALINAHVARSTRLSTRMTPQALAKVMGRIERSPSMERAGQIERENYQRERRGRISRDDDVDRKLREMSEAKISSTEQVSSAKVVVKDPNEDMMEAKESVEIFVFNEEDVEIPYEFHGEPEFVEEDWDYSDEWKDITVKASEEDAKEEQGTLESDAERAAVLVTELFQCRRERQEALQRTFDEIAELVDKFNTAHYDLGMVAGRQMSTTSGEFIVHHIEKEILAYIDDQIAILPDPDLKKKKAKPEEVAMIRELFEAFLDENMDVICPEAVEEEEAETPIPEIITIYAVPGIGPTVDDDMIHEFIEYALEVSKMQVDLLMPRNIRHFLCPPLEKYVEINYDHHEHHDPHAHEKKEEAPTSGAITD